MLINPNGMTRIVLLSVDKVGIHMGADQRTRLEAFEFEYESVFDYSDLYSIEARNIIDFEVLIATGNFDIGIVIYPEYLNDEELKLFNNIIPNAASLLKGFVVVTDFEQKDISTENRQHGHVVYTWTPDQYNVSTIREFVLSRLQGPDMRPSATSVNAKMPDDKNEISRMLVFNSGMVDGYADIYEENFEYYDSFNLKFKNILHVTAATLSDFIMMLTTGLFNIGMISFPEKLSSNDWEKLWELIPYLGAVVNGFVIVTHKVRSDFPPEKGNYGNIVQTFKPTQQDVTKYLRKRNAIFLTDFAQDIFDTFAQRLEAGVIPGRQPSVFDPSPQRFHLVEVGTIWRQEKEPQPLFLPLGAFFSNDLSAMDACVI